MKSSCHLPWTGPRVFHAPALPPGLQLLAGRFTEFFADWGVRGGIKLATACLIALTLAEWIRLDEPTWAVTTAFVLSTPKYVGAIAEKTVFRIAGAILGACIGYLITGSLQQSPLLFLGAMGALLTLTTAMYGGTFAPYLIRQCGYTATLVAAQGMNNPAFSWQVGLARCEEICLGIAVTSCVTALIWPRYARVEFVSGTRASLRLLAGQFQARAAAFASEGPEPSGDVLARMGASLAKLRSMIHLGTIESRHFREQKEKVDNIVAALGGLSTSVASLSGSLSRESLYRRYIGVELVDLHSTIERLFHVATQRSTSGEIEDAILAAHNAMAGYERGMERLRAAGVGGDIPLEESLGHGGYHLAVREILSSLELIARGLPKVEENLHSGFPSIRLAAPKMPPAGWWLAGLRGALAVVTALVLVNWLKPPGGEMLIVGTYLFSAFTLESADHRGDVGVFQLTIFFALCGVVLLFALLLLSPLMSNYAVFAVLFGSVLFLTGYWMEHATLSMFVTIWLLLLASNLVGLNPQDPVPFSSIENFVLGMSLATVLSALVRRLLWPSLPQRALMDRIEDAQIVLRHAALHPRESLTASLRARLVLALAESRQLARTLAPNPLSNADSVRLDTYLGALEELAALLIPLPGSRMVGLDERAAVDFASHLEQVTGIVAAHLDAQRRHFAGDSAGAPPTENPATREWLTSFRAHARSLRLPIATILADHGRLDRLHRAVPAASLATEAVGAISPARITADWRL